jgi:hypothetical protein
MVDKRIFYIIFLIFFINGCTNLPIGTSTEELQISEKQTTRAPQMPPTETAYIFKTSEPGLFTIKGELIVKEPFMMAPDPDDGLFLVPMDDPEGNITTVPKFEIGQVPQAEVDEVEGLFAFTDIDPGQYAVVVLTMNGSQIPAKFMESESLAILALEESQPEKIIELGYLFYP